MYRHIIQEIDAETGVVVEEKHRLDRRLHRDPSEGPAHIYRNRDTGAITGMRYYWKGRLHRKDGPALISYGSGVITEEYYQGGLLHRDPKEGPSRSERNSNGVLTVEAYSLYGQPYRDAKDGPQYCERDEDGSIIEEKYCTNEAPPSRSTIRRGPRPGRGTEPSF
jgi:hypothetical protein